VRLDSTLAEVWLARGSLLRFGDQRRFTGVREALQRAVDLEPGNAEAHHEFGMVLRLLSDNSAAADQFRQALAIEPDRPMSLVHLGWIDMARRRYGEARRWLDSAVAVNPGFFQAYMERAQLRLAMGDTAGVHQATAWAALLVAAGEYPEAIAFLKRARVDPSHLRIHLEEPKFAPLRGDPRFEQLMKALRVREAE
jgi:tetratricopeptide (TPR) repeat protein